MKPDIKRQSVNQLLNSLEPGAFERVAKKLTRVKLRPKEIVYKPNEPIDHVIFPENAVVCLMTIMSNGETIEAATVGREGASWISASVGAAGEPLPGELPGPLVPHGPHRGRLGWRDRCRHTVGGNGSDAAAAHSVIARVRKTAGRHQVSGFVERPDTTEVRGGHGRLMTACPV